MDVAQSTLDAFADGLLAVALANRPGRREGIAPEFSTRRPPPRDPVVTRRGSGLVPTRLVGRVRWVDDGDLRCVGHTSTVNAPAGRAESVS